MTRRKSHLVSLSWIVGNDEVTATIRVIFTRIYYFFYLIYAFPVEISPLIAINRSEFTPLFREIIISFYFLNKYFHFLLPFWSIFWIFYSQIIFFQVGLKWPLIPDSYIIINKIFDIGISRKEPEKLMDDTFCEYFLRCQKRKSFL